MNKNEKKEKTMHKKSEKTLRRFTIALFTASFLTTSIAIADSVEPLEYCNLPTPLPEDSGGTSRSVGKVVPAPEPTQKPVYSRDDSVRCEDYLGSYRDFIQNDEGKLDSTVRINLQNVLDGPENCDNKVAQIEAILNDFWATEPWCKKDRDAFRGLLTAEVKAAIPASSQETIAALLDQGHLTCSETLSAAITVVRLFNPTFTTSADGGVVVFPEVSAQSGVQSSVSRSILADAQKRSVKRKLRSATKRLNSCQKSIKRHRLSSRTR